MKGILHGVEEGPPPAPGQLDFGLDVPYGFRTGDLVKVEGLRGTFRFVAVKHDRGGAVADVYGPLPSGGRLVGAAKLRSVDPRRVSRD